MNLLLLLILAAPPKPGGPYIATQGNLIEVEIEEDKAGKIGFHNPYDITDLFVRDAVPKRAGTLCLIIQPKKAQIYRLTLWTVGESTGISLILDASPPIPPTPPTPPVPPVPPTPDTPLTLALRAAYAKDSDPGALIRSKLMAVYANAEAAEKASPVGTWGQYFTNLSTAIQSVVGPPTVLPETRKAIAAYLKTRLPTTSLKLMDDEGRKLAALTWNEIATSLGKLP